jgi:competence ComEA-like helix-hairpin-helix protein
MHKIAAFSKSHYFNTCISSAKLLSLLIFTYCGVICLACNKSEQKSILTVKNQPEISETALNINKATAEQLEKLPRVGKETARKIIEHREKYGAFRRPENLILVPGMSDKKFRAIRSLIKAE